MSKNRSMDGLYTDSGRGQQIASTRALGLPFYVAGERHENLPAGGFAGRKHARFAGTPNQTIRYQPTHFEYATGSDGQFGHADFGHGHGATQVGVMGDLTSWVKGAITDVEGVSNSAETAVSQAQGIYAQAEGLLPTSAAAPAQVAVAPAAGLMSMKVYGIPVVVLLALLAAAAVLYSNQRKRA